VTADRLAELHVPYNEDGIAHLRRMFKPDGLLRLARSTPEYYDTHGDYLPGVALLAYLDGERVRELEDALRRATFLAEHLMQMIDRETWRATGGDDGQGHYEGDHHEAEVARELKDLAALASPERTKEQA
jgi:hypothetical protein